MTDPVLRERFAHVKYDRLPEDTQEPLRRYVERGEIPGGFLTAVLENNLVDAFGYADETNRARLHDFALWLWNECPRAAWGSRGQVEAWAEKHEADR